MDLFKRARIRNNSLRLKQPRANIIHIDNDFHFIGVLVPVSPKILHRLSLYHSLNHSGVLWKIKFNTVSVNIYFLAKHPPGHGTVYQELVQSRAHKC